MTVYAHISSGDSGSEERLGTCSVDINYAQNPVFG